MSKICPACGLPAVSGDGFDPPLTGIKARIFNLIRLRPGIGSNDLVNWVYADNINGGPDTGQKVIHVHISQINRRLRHLRAEVRIRGSKWKGYHLIREQKKETENGKRNHETGTELL